MIVSPIQGNRYPKRFKAYMVNVYKSNFNQVYRQAFKRVINTML